MIISSFYPTTSTYEDFQSTALLTNISTSDYPDLLDKTKDPVRNYYMGTAPANNVLFQYDYKIEEEDDVNVFKLISKNTPTKWFYYMSSGSATSNFTPTYNGTRWAGNVHFINSMAAYKMNYAHDVTMTFEYYQYLQDAELNTGERVKEYQQNGTYSYSFQNQTTTADTNIYDFFESNNAIILTFGSNNYTFHASDWDEDAWCFKVPNSQDRIYLQGISVSDVADYNGSYYPGGSIKLGVAQTIETLNDGGTNLGCIYAESIHSYQSEELRLVYMGGSQTYPLYSIYTGSFPTSYVNYKVMPDNQTFGKVKPFEVTISVCYHAYQRDGKYILNSNDDLIYYAGQGEGSYFVRINRFTNLLGWYRTIYCIIPKTVTQKNADGATVTPVSPTNEYRPFNAVPIFQNNVPTGHMEKTNTYPTLEPQLMTWQKYGHNINEDEFDPDNPEPEGGDDPDENPENEDPETGPDKDDRGDQIPGIDGNNYPANPSPFVKYGLFSYSDLQDLSLQLWDKPVGFFEAISASQSVNPMDYFLSLRWYPIEFNLSDSQLHPEMFLGRGGKLLVNHKNFAKTVQVINWGTVQVKPFYKNFLDYQPYTKVYIFLPFCGQIELNSTVVMGKTLLLKSACDITDGSIVWQVYNETDKQPILTKQARLGCEIPITSLNASQMGANIVNASLGTLNTVMGTGGQILNQAKDGMLAGSALGPEGAIAGSVIGGTSALLSNTANLIASFSNLGMASKEIVQLTGGTSGMASSLSDRVPYIIYQRPLATNPSTYGHTTGFLCNKTATIDSMRGFTICKNVDTSSISQATSKEKGMIKKILDTGFYA